MLGDVMLRLNPVVQLVPRQEWPRALQRSHGEQWTAAISAPGLRTTSRLIDEPARRLLAQFSEAGVSGSAT